VFFLFLHCKEQYSLLSSDTLFEHLGFAHGLEVSVFTILDVETSCTGTAKGSVMCAIGACLGSGLSLRPGH